MKGSNIAAFLPGPEDERRCSDDEIEKLRRLAFSRILPCSPECPVCYGIGYIASGAELGEPGFGKVSHCPNAAHPALSPERAGLHPADLALKWGGLKKVNGAEAAVGAIQKALAAGSGWVYLWGSPGMGKSYIIKTAIANALCSGASAAYTTMTDILDDIRAGIQSSDSVERLRRWSTIKFLAIDEMDKPNPTEYGKERQNVLLDARYEGARRGETITLFASNQPPESLPFHLADRIMHHQFTVVHMSGTSLRSGKRWGDTK